MKAWVCALVIMLVCAKPTATRAYAEYVPTPQPPAKRQQVESIKINATGYYGPTKGQKKYMTGSYEEEVKLNVSGKITSSGAPLKLGTIAADTEYYPYGTKILFKERNLIGIVQDTGAKIKGRNRMDFFCGWGDQGLEKALTWDKKQTVTAEILYMPEKPGRS